MRWQLQEAKQRFSELVERARLDGPQVVTRRGRPVVIVDIDRYRAMAGDEGDDFKAFLLSMPPFEAPSRDRARRVEL